MPEPNQLRGKMTAQLNSIDINLIQINPKLWSIATEIYREYRAIAISHAENK